MRKCDRDRIDYQYLIDTGKIRNRPMKKSDILIRFFLILGIISLILVIFSTGVNAQVTVTASVECNPYNCVQSDGNRGGTGIVMGINYHAEKIMEEPEIVEFRTPYGTWYVSHYGTHSTISEALSVSLSVK